MMRVHAFSRRVRASEYHITNACNIRCKGCWFFEYGFDRQSKEVREIENWRDFVANERAKGITAALLIGGEPTLFPERIQAFVDQLQFVTISSNGLRPFSRHEFPNVAVALTLFGGGVLDDELRGWKPNGSHFGNLLETALRHYHQDARAHFIYAITEGGVGLLEETVKRIRDNGNRLTFNYYSNYGGVVQLGRRASEALLEEALRVRQAYPETVTCTEYYIRTLISGKSHFGSFGYDVCPSISVDHPAHEQRLKNGNPHIRGFNTYSADLETVAFCCTSGHCGDCRDSQAVYSWLLANHRRFGDSVENLGEWVGIAEAYWDQFIWSPFNEHTTAGRERFEEPSVALDGNP
jgi:hypothetical protein